MRSRIARALLWLAIAQAVAAAVGQVLARKMTEGDESTDRFKLAAIFGGKQFRSRAKELESGSVVAAMGGVDLDLRDVTLDPAGAELDLKAMMGGIRVVVPTGWAIDVDADSVAGGFEMRTSEIGELPDDAPRLRINAFTRMGGMLVTTDAEEDLRLPR